MSEKRRALRIPVDMTADVINGNQVFQDCDIVDISSGGLRINNIKKNDHRK